MKLKAPKRSCALERKDDFPFEAWTYSEFENIDLDYWSEEHLKIDECTFKKVRFSHCFFPALDCMDAIFTNCDLANTRWEESSMHRIVFENCSLMGCDFSSSSLHDIHFKNCKASYSNFSNINGVRLHFEDCDISHSSFNESKCKEVVFTNCNLQESEFIHTPLKDIDFSSSNIEGFSVTIDSLKGAIVSETQAIALSKLLGLQIKDH